MISPFPLDDYCVVKPLVAPGSRGIVDVATVAVAKSQATAEGVGYAAITFVRLLTRRALYVPHKQNDSQKS